MVTLDDLRSAQARLQGVARQTPLLLSRSLSEGVGQPVYLKAESLQFGGAFKLRGAYNKVSSLSAGEKARGVVAHSSGNHAQAVAFACKLLGVKAVIVIPENAVQVKVQATLSHGAQVVRSGPSLEEREQVVGELRARHGYVLVHPFDDPLIIAGQGTAGLEIVEALPGVATVFVPIGGGGLISGTALAAKSLKPGVRVIGVEPEGANDAYRSMREGHIVTLDHVDTVADGLRSSHVGRITYEMIKRYVDDIVLVSDAEILDTVQLLLGEEHLVVEPSGAVAATALRLARAGRAAGPSVAVLSGGNIDPTLLRSLLQA